jgi:hypothetical protein
VTLLREIRVAATDSGVEISTVLRKAKSLATRLRNPEFEAWVDRELNEGASRKSMRRPWSIGERTARRLNR